MASKTAAKKAPAKKAPVKKAKVKKSVQPGDYDVAGETSILLDSEPHISLAFGGPVKLTVSKTDDGKTLLTFKKG